MTRPHGYYDELEELRAQVRMYARQQESEREMTATTLAGIEAIRAELGCAMNYTAMVEASRELRVALAETTARYAEQCDLTREMRANVDVYREEIAALRARVAALEPRP